MAHSFAEYKANSRIVDFLVGEEKILVKVHAATIAKQSDILNSLINGTMAEAVEGRVVWEDVDVDTFERFMQFAYIGDYSTPVIETNEEEEDEVLAAKNDKIEISMEADPQVKYGCSWEKSSTAYKNKEFRSDPGFLQTLGISILSTFNIKNLLSSEIYARTNGRSEDFLPVLLCHARLYVFAEKYQIFILKVLSLRKLQLTLINYNAYPERINEIIELVRYAYSDDNTPDRDDRIDDLRVLVTYYVSGIVKIIGKSPEFVELLEEGGAFVRDFWPFVCEKIK